jgi:putative phosphoesterase
VDAVRAARAWCMASGVERVIHCGDITEPETVRLFEGLDFSCCYGNCDRRKVEIAAAVREIGGRCFDPVGELYLDGKRICFLHGDSHAALFGRTYSGEFDYLVFGHLHRTVSELRGPTRCINPGALSSGSAGTFAVLDTAADEVSFVRVGETGDLS